MNKLRNVFLLLLPVFLFVGCIEDEKTGSGSCLMHGDELPDFSVISVDGKTLTKSDLEGKVSLLVFFKVLLSVCLLLVGFGSLPNDGRLGSTINSTAQFFCNGVHMQHSAQFYSTLLSSELGCSSGRRIPDRHFSFVFLQKTLQQAVRNTNQKPRTNQQSFRSRH